MSKSTRTHWKKLTDPRFIGVYALPNEGDDLTVEITHVTHEEVKMMGGKVEPHTIAHLKGHKPLILNKTNSLSIEKLYGPYIETWSGKLVTLYASVTNIGKEKNIPCLRVRPQVATKKKQFIADERLKKALDQIKAGAYTEKQLRETFELTAEQEAMIKANQEQPA